MQRKLSWFAWIALALTLGFGTVSAHAQVFLIDTSTSTGAIDFDAITDNDELLAQQFTITAGTWEVSEVAVLLGSGSPRNADISIFSDNAGQPDALLDFDFFPFYDPIGGGFEVAYFNDWNLTLTPGNYWLVLGGTSGTNTGTLDWAYVDNAGGGIGLNSGIAGLAQNLYARSSDNGTTWTTLSPGTSEYYYFALGTSAPEPGTLGLLALGGVLGIRRQRRKN